MPGPNLEFDWELDLFKALRAMWRSVTATPIDPLDSETAVQVAAHLGRLSTFGSLIAGRPLSVEGTRDAGGIRGTTVLVPRFLDVVPDPELNLSLYLMRVAIDARTVGRGFSGVGPEATVREGALSMQMLSQELPRFEEALGQAKALLATVEQSEHLLWGRLLEVCLPENPASSEDAPPSADATEEHALDVTDVRVLSLEEEKSVEAPIHSFEKVDLLERFNGHLRQLDGDDDLQDHLEALDEVDLSALIRGGPQAHSVLRAEIALDAQIPDAADIAPDEQAIRYPEWDSQKRAYKPDWCAVYPTSMPRLATTGLAAESLARQARSLDAVRTELSIQRQRRRAQPRMPDGEDLDLDAVIDTQVALRAGRTPTERVYTRQKQREREVATTLLVDVSLSADSWVDNRRVWDVTRDALWVLGEAMAEVGDALQILAFASHTRHQVRVYTVLDWHEPWEVGKHRLEHLRPQGYTRIGPALRHATALLVGQPARAKQLVVVSDCKPTDYDRYEGRHGVADVQRALQDARADGVAVFGLAVDDVARDRLPSMFGPGAWSLLHDPSQLSGAVARMQRWRRL